MTQAEAVAKLTASLATMGVRFSAQPKWYRDLMTRALMAQKES